MTERRPQYDAVVVGAGPNGLSAAIVLCQAGLSVMVIEASDTAGGGARTKELTLPGFRHDVCSAIHPMGVLSPFFRTLPLQRHGVVWIEPPAALAHPLDDGSAALLQRDLDATCDGLGADGAAWRALMAPLCARADDLFEALLGPLRVPRHPLLLLRFALRACRSALGLARRWRTARARALFGGCAAHSFLPLEQSFSAAIGIVLALAGHAVGWPLPRGGSQAIVDALAALLLAHGGCIETGRPIRSLRDLPPSRVTLFNLTPRQLAAIAGEALPPSYVRKLLAYRYGPGSFKIDYALREPIPWKAPECARAPTVHLGGTIEELAQSERAIWRGEHHERPYVLCAQQSLFDATRAPDGKHTCWAYCHVPHGSPRDMTAAIEAQIERFAPGFRDVVLARHTLAPQQFERYNENYVGGDITGGVTDLGQLFSRPVSLFTPYATPNPAIYLCSSSTPPGAGVHGMCGSFAARAVLRRVFGR